MRSKPVTLVGLLQAAAFATVLFSVVTSFDFVHHSIELFSHFRLQYLVVSVLLLIVFVFLGSPIVAIFLLGATILNATYVLPWYFGNTASDNGQPLKILHANLLSTNTQYDRLFELVEAEKPDIIFLQEFTPAWLDASTQLLEDYPFSYAEARQGNFGIAMFSRLEIESATHINSPPLDYPTIVATANINNQPLTLINTHPTIPLGSTLYHARNEHLDSVAGIANRAEGAVILTGDFNTSVWNRRYRRLEESTGLRNSRRGFGVQPSWPTFMPFAMIPIDHALVSDEISVVATRTGRRIGSDHLPLIVELAVGR